MKKDILLSGEALRKRIEQVKELLADTKEYGRMEYLVIPAVTEEGEKEAPIFIFPGGGTHLLPCFEMGMYLDRKLIIVSPFGYGKSDDLLFYDEGIHHNAGYAVILLKFLREERVVLFGHSNGAIIASEIANRIGVYNALVVEMGDEKKLIKVEKLIIINPLGIRKLSKIWIALAFAVSGLLTRIFSWGYQNPTKLMADAYHPPKRQEALSQKIQKLWYELEKSSQPFLEDIIPRLKNDIVIDVIQSKWDWASFHWPWSKTNEEILRGYIYEDNIMNFIPILGLHNVTLGKDSKKLAATILSCIED